MVWHITDIQHPHGVTMCALRGYHDVVYRVVRFKSNNYFIQRIRGEGIVDFETQIYTGSSGTRVSGSINKQNSIALLFQTEASKLTLMHVTQYGTIKWQMDLTGPSRWDTSAVLISDNIYVGVGITGTYQGSFTDDGIAMAFTLSGQAYWIEKLLHDVSAITTHCDVVYFTGMVAEDMVVQPFDNNGHKHAVLSTTGLDIMAVHSSCVTPSGCVYFTGLTTENDKLQLFTLSHQVGTCEFSTHPLTELATTRASSVFSEVFPVCGSVVVHAAVEDQGSWFLQDGIAKHHFTDDFQTSTPRAWCASDERDGDGSVVLVKAGAFRGDFIVDKIMYDAGRDENVSYIMTFKSYAVV